MPTPPWEVLLSFWFGPTADDAAVARRQAPLWWSKNPDLDRVLGERLAALLPQPADGPLPWPDSPRGRLARVILMDQLPRNLYRGRPAAFAWDGPARQAAGRALAAGDEEGLRPVERAFLYMPFEHAEDAACQDLAVARFIALCAGVPAAGRGVFLGFLDFGRRHRDIIRRFGRFPHRNAILGRRSTPEEERFLLEPGASF